MKLSKLGACVLAGAMLLPLFAGCAGTWTGGELGNDVELGQNDTSNRSGWVLRERPSADAFADKDLYITYFNGGYGGAWLEEMASTFEEDYPGVQVHLNLRYLHQPGHRMGVSRRARVARRPHVGAV